MGPGSGYNASGGAATTVDSKPVLLSNPPPVYTDEARAARIQGVVTARLRVGSDGRVKQVKIVQGLPGGLNEQAIQAAYQYRYKPALKDGKPVSYWVSAQIEFNLR